MKNKEFILPLCTSSPTLSPSSLCHSFFFSALSLSESPTAYMLHLLTVSQLLDLPFRLFISLFFFCLSVWKVSIDLSSGLWILFWFVWNLLAIPWKAFFISVTLLSMSSVSFHCSLECVPLLILPIFDAYYLLATFVSESHSGDSLVSSEYLCVSMHVCCVMCVCLTFGLPCNFLLEARHVASGKTKWGK